MDKFVDEWNIVQTLGEGAYGEVKLLVHQISGDAVAMKVVDLRKSKDAIDCVKKEEKIHRLMIHPNIIKLLGKREELSFVYIFLEYAAGGELFNKIEPDIGMYAGEAQNYLRQLLAGMQYLHSKGIAHRDIKPENLLLDDLMNLKISDFGMATIFRLKGKERKLDKKCGTLPYVAPEVLEDTYYAQPADLWSCGIVFVAMLAGELPWDEPRPFNPEFMQWKTDSCITQTPWSKLSTTAYSLARKLLNPDPGRRYTLQQLLQHPWMMISFDSHDTLDGSHTIGSDDSSNKRRASIKETDCEPPTVVLSQPVSRGPNIEPGRLALLLEDRRRDQHVVCFSQPTQNEHMLMGSSQLQLTQSPLTQTNFQRLVKRMTRFFVNTTHCEKAITQLCTQLDKMNFTWTSDPSGVVTISTMDSRKMQLVFKANIIDMDGKLLMDFRLSKGCGLEFKRRFLKIKNSLSDIIAHK